MGLLLSAPQVWTVVLPLKIWNCWIAPQDSKRCRVLIVDLVKALVVKLATFYQWLFPIAVGINLPKVLGINLQSDVWLWAGTGILIVLLLLKAFVYRELRRELKQIRETIKTSLRHLLTDTQDVLTSSDRDSADQLENMIKRVPTYLVPLAGTGVSVQAQVFLVYEHSGHQHFVSEVSSNGVWSTHHFSNETKEGVATDEMGIEVWNAALIGKTRYFPNLSFWKSPFSPCPSGWKRFRSHRRYKSFITAPIFGSEDQPVGLLTINAQKPHALSEVDAEIVELIVNALQIANQRTKTLDKPRQYTTLLSSMKQGGCGS